MAGTLSSPPGPRELLLAGASAALGPVHLFSLTSEGCGVVGGTLVLFAMYLTAFNLYLTLFCV